MAKAVSKLKVSGVDICKLDVTTKSDLAAIRSVTESLKADFLAHKVDCVEIVSMHYLSAGKQVLRRQQLLPVSPEAFGNVNNSNRPYIFEPDVNKIYNTILPLYIISVMQEVFIQNSASEQAARVMAMQSANDNAVKLLDSLKLEFNKLRQQSITTELLDILGGQVEK